MVRARLVAINGKQVGAEDFSEERAKRQIEREFNVTHLSALPATTSSPRRMVRRRGSRACAISIEHWIAERFGIRVGDTLEFLSAGRSFSAPVTSVRKLDWDSMRPNFFFVTTPAMLESFPASYIASFHAPAGDVLLTLRLSQAFPNLTVIDVSVILRQLQLVMDQLIGAVQLVFLFALGAGVLVLYAALLATQDERTHEAAVMRALGRAAPRYSRRSAPSSLCSVRSRGSLAPSARPRSAGRSRRACSSSNSSGTAGSGSPARARPRLHRVERLGGGARGTRPPADGSAARGHLRSRRYNEPWLKSLSPSPSSC